MNLDFSRYNVPGVYGEAVDGPQVSASLSAPTAVGLFGDSVRYRTDIETLRIPADSAGAPVATAALRQVGVKDTTIVVKLISTGETLTLTTDYTLVAVAGVNAATTRDDTYAIKRANASTKLLENADIQVTYQYTNTGYFDAKMFYDFDDVRDQYGPAFDAQGNVTSELTLAARFAFMNGARQIVCVAVDAADVLPTAAEYAAALDKLRNESTISVVVPATGDQAVHSYVVAHVREQSLNQNERRAIVARDGSVTAVDNNTLTTNAASISERRVALVGPAIVNYYNSDLNTVQAIGGQYLAAALAGVSVRLNPSQPLTRKSIVGFSGFPTTPSQSEKSLLATNGVMVVEQTRQGNIRVMHGLTTDVTNLMTREWSLIGQEDALAFRLRDFLDNDQLIGNAITEITLGNVKASADSALQSLVIDTAILGYRDLKVRQLQTSPDVLEIRFEWSAAAPLNYIVARYSVNVTSGAVVENV